MSGKRFISPVERTNPGEYIRNKQVLLRERKRHTACCVASTCYAVPVGGNPPSLDLTWTGGTPFQVLGGGVPLPRSGQGGPPSQVWTGGTCSQVWMVGTPFPSLDRGVTPGYLPSARWGCPPSLRWGPPPPIQTRKDGGAPVRKDGGTPIGKNGIPPICQMGYPSPPRRCEQTEIITFPHPSDAGGNNQSRTLFSLLPSINLDIIALSSSKIVFDIFKMLFQEKIQEIYPHFYFSLQVNNTEFLLESKFYTVINKLLVY